MLCVRVECVCMHMCVCVCVRGVCVPVRTCGLLIQLCFCVFRVSLWNLCLRNVHARVVSLYGVCA